MKHLIGFSLAVLLLTTGVVAQETAQPSSNPQVALETSKGKITVELFADKAPITVKNFLSYVESGFFDGTIFHRVMPDFMIQGGGFTVDLKKKDPKPPIQNEAKNGLKNDRGTLGMARTDDPHSATAQFFINLVDNEFLNPSPRSGAGYAVFGKVIAGMEVVDEIAKAKTTRRGPHGNVPIEAVVITKASLLGAAE
jgi:cyclophilin family peptidyl-prolyl cis-trans isomerase